MKALTTYQNFYFVGIGGIGMSALARYFNASGKTVLGYDKMHTKLTMALVEEGIDIEFEDFINDNFQISNVSSKNLFLKFSNLSPILGDDAKRRGIFEDDILANMEVTLYPDWAGLVKDLKKEISVLKIDFESLRKKTGFKKCLALFRT